MCGFAGKVAGQRDGFAERAAAALDHRGPDGYGSWEGDGIELVHTRLAILDLSNAGAQPMTWQDPNETGKICVLVFNGEIYNHVELRREMEACGESFTGTSDTEVLLRLLVREGEAALPKLAGMFAFAFWDGRSQRMLLARDPMGIKPLYYRIDREVLSFASETRVLELPEDKPDAAALRDFFLWGSVPEPQTLRLQIRNLPAGHLLRWIQGKSEICQWARATAAPAHEDPVVVTREALLESMRRHLVSDVPVGIFLSGGIDSTALLALAREVLGDSADIRTFSIGFEEASLDESVVAKRTAAHFGARHTEWRMTQEDGIGELPLYLQAIDQPTIDGFNTWCISKLASREGMKVVLSGLGGDEWFAGYSSFNRVPQLRAFHRLLGPLRPLLARVIECKPVGSPCARLASFLRSRGGWLEAYHAQRGVFTPEEAATLAEAMAGAPPDAADWVVLDLPAHPREIVSVLELTRYMRNQLLRDSDVFSMAHGLELRVPLVDERLARTLRSIPPHCRLRGGKQLLLEAVPEIPDWVRTQPKRGFAFPFKQWLQIGMGEVLDHAKKESPVPLGTWYRAWAFAAASHVLRRPSPRSPKLGS